MHAGKPVLGSKFQVKVKKIVYKILTFRFHVAVSVKFCSLCETAALLARNLKSRDAAGGGNN